MCMNDKGFSVQNGITYFNNGSVKQIVWDPTTHKTTHNRVSNFETNDYQDETDELRCYLVRGMLNV